MGKWENMKICKCANMQMPQAERNARCKIVARLLLVDRVVYSGN
jgi:hypothetical protein